MDKIWHDAFVTILDFLAMVSWGNWVYPVGENWIMGTDILGVIIIHEFGDMNLQF